MMPGMPPPNRGMGEEPKDEGPAEKAPEEEQRPSDVEPLGAYPEQRRRRTQIFELDGYFRTRGEWMHKFNLGQGYLVGSGATQPPPFPLPLSCGDMPGPGAGACDSQTLGSGNMRLRFEPTVNVTEQVRVMSQIDVLDNVIMGSTPESLVGTTRLQDPSATGMTSLRSGEAPSDLQSNRQVPPEVGRNGVISSIRAKRAWAEVDSPFGSLRFGRMPWQFGRGMYFNNGNCADCDYGTTVDRVMALTRLYGHQVALSWDFGAQGPNTAWTYLGQRDPQGAAIDLGQRDDVYQLTATILRLDDDATFKERLGRGETVANYGFQLVYRDQKHAVFDVPTPGVGNTLLTPEDLQRTAVFVRDVNAYMFIPDLWFKLGWRALTIEFEGVAVLGHMDKSPPALTEAVGTAPYGGELKFAQFGYVLATELAFFKNSFFVGFETGGASGDQAENRNGYLNYMWRSPARQPTGDRNIGDFHFSPDYHVDQILFRYILGTVNNAVYFKPQAAYWLNLAEPRQLGITASAIYSGAMVPVATPGNQFSYGLEFDAGLTYRNPADGFYAGIVYGVLFPMGALDRLNTASTQTSVTRQDAETAQIIRLFAGVRF
jgi:uncharacterized protein (TIGR04551 family)